jgi:hypothetical protein
MPEKLPPLCRHCGNAIPKRVTSIYVRDPGSPPSAMKDSITPDTFLKTKTDCEQYTEFQVVSVRYWPEPERHITRFGVWDGVTYESQYFCNDGCAKSFGYLMVREGNCTRKYNEMVKLQAITRTPVS